MKYLLTIIPVALVLILSLALINAFNIYLPIQIVNTSKSIELSVVGEGKVDVVPDMAQVDVGITVDNAATVELAQQNIDKVNNAIVTSMKALGISKEDIKTSNYSIYPNYIYDNNQNKQSGYNGNVTVNIKVKDIKKVSQVISEATKAGANQVQGTSFSVEDPQKYRTEARSKAIANAKEQANKLAKDLGIKLGKITNVVEYSPTQPSYAYAYADAMAMNSKQAMSGGGGPQLEEGTQTITSVVTLYFEKK